MTSLIKYEAACRAIAEAEAVDEVKDLLDKADAFRIYARQAKNVEMENKAKVIRWRAIRRLGEMIEGQPKAKGTRGQLKGKNTSGGVEITPPENPEITLEAAGIDKNLAKVARRYASVDGNSFERLIERCNAAAERESVRLPLDVLAEESKEARKAEMQKAYEERKAAGCSVADLNALVEQGRKFKTILADPPWDFQTYSEFGKDRSPDYDTKGIERIKALPVRELAADDATLHLWVLMNQLPEALEVIDAWGFTFKTCGFAWMKQNRSGAGLFLGMGYWTRANVEICLLATKGAPRRFDRGVPQALLSPIMEHSHKPEEFHERIERLVEGPYLELYARRERKGWVTWGNEIPRGNFFNTAAADQQTGEIAHDDDSDIRAGRDDGRGGGAGDPLPAAEVQPGGNSGRGELLDSASDPLLDIIPDFLRRRKTPAAASAEAK